MRLGHVRGGRIRSRAARAWLACWLVAVGACSGLTENDTLPPNVRDPDETRTPEGALAVYQGVRHAFRAAFGTVDGAVLAGALLTDELGDRYGQPVLGLPVDLDRRHLPENDRSLPLLSQSPYFLLHRVRGQANEAIGLLAAYAPEASPALRGHAYALAGYAEVFLADLYCSGIPLSTVDFEGDYTLAPGSATAEVYRHALGLLDTALVLAGDSVNVQHLTRVGRGRTLLALGRYEEAGVAVAEVPDGFSYSLEYDAEQLSFMSKFADVTSAVGTMTDREGRNGIPYLSSGDPRVVADSSLGDNQWGFPVVAPAKYDASGTGPMILADWIEARLIEAEAALQAGDAGAWLAKLNHLRRTAITPALADTTDPGANNARVSLTFRERAFWLFLTGHRQGDLRRYARQYGREQETLYPSGFFPGGIGVYGTDVTLPVPSDEREQNPRYSGCFGRGA